jgi:serine/threonine protein kinase
VAIKVLPDAFGQDPVRVARFEREARAAAALNHPNICAIHEIGEHEGQPFIVMELMKGQTLEARLSTGGRLECDEALELGTQLADALDAAHTAGAAVVLASIGARFVRGELQAGSAADRLDRGTSVKREVTSYITRVRPTGL